MSTTVLNKSKMRLILSMAISYLTFIITLNILMIIVLNDYGQIDVWGWKKVILFSILIVAYYAYNIACMMIVSLSYYIIESLNQLLERKIMMKDETSEKEMRKILKNSCKIHDKLCELFETLSLLYTINTLTIFLSFLFASVFSVFGVYSYIKAPSVQRLILNVMFCIWNSLFLPYVFWTVTYSSWIERDGRQTVDLMRRLMFQEKYLDSLGELDIFYRQVIHRTPFVSVMVDRINWNFFFTVLSGIFSFSIILIQFYDVSD